MWQGLEEHVTARDAAVNDREAGIAECKTKAAELLNHLQAAAVYLLSLEFQYILSPALQKWGYDVIHKRSQTNGTSGDDSYTTEEISTNGSDSLTETVSSPDSDGVAL